MSSLWWLRWAMVAVGAALGGVLIASHHGLIGFLILAMALMRAIVLVTIRRRRTALGAWRAGRFGGPGY